MCSFITLSLTFESLVQSDIIVSKYFQSFFHKIYYLSVSLYLQVVFYPYLRELASWHLILLQETTEKANSMYMKYISKVLLIHVSGTILVTANKVQFFIALNTPRSFLLPLIVFRPVADLYSFICSGIWLSGTSSRTNKGANFKKKYEVVQELLYQLERFQHSKPSSLFFLITLRCLGSSMRHNFFFSAWHFLT